MLLGVASGQTPSAAFDGTPISGTAPLTVTFTDQSTGNPTGWAWYFGDENFTVPWTQMTSSAGWSARMNPRSVVMPDGSIVLMGGGYGAFKNDVWRSTDAGAMWTQMTSSAGWSARSGHSSVAMPDGSIVLMGGNDGSPKNDTWRSTDNGVIWTQVTANAGWKARWSYSSVVMPDGSIVLMGGSNGAMYMNDTWRSTDYGMTWTQMTANAGWTSRFSHSSVAMPDGSIVLMGGIDDEVRIRNDTWRSTDNGATWTEVNISPEWVGRNGLTSVAMPDGSIVLMGGGNYDFMNDTWRSTDNGSTWTQLTTSAEWPGRYFHCSVVLPDSSIVLMGGYDAHGGINGGIFNDTWRFMPAGSSAKNPSHTYTTPGIYQVLLQAYNADGYNSTRKSGYITVGASSASVASITGTPRSGTTPLTVTTGVVVTIIATLLVRRRWIRK